jgi:DNA-binding transcriptional MerR regulator
MTEPARETEDRPALSPAQLALHLGVPVQTLYYWTCVGLGPASHRVGKYVRYEHLDVAQWLSEHLDPQ